MKAVTKELAKKVLSVVDKGLVSGLGKPIPGQMCVEAAVCYAMGEDHGDQPSCVAPAVRHIKIALNDSNWSSNAARTKGLRKLAIAQLGSKDTIDEKAFATYIAEQTIRRIVPLALESAASVATDTKHKTKLKAAAERCRQEGTQDAAESAKSAAKSAAEYAAKSAAEYAAKSAAEYAAEYAAESAKYAAEYAAKYAAEYAKYAAEYAAKYAAEYAAEYAAKSAEYAEYAAKSAEYAESSDKVLFIMSEIVLEALQRQHAPGCEYLYLVN